MFPSPNPNLMETHGTKEAVAEGFDVSSYYDIKWNMTTNRRSQILKPEEHSSIVDHPFETLSMARKKKIYKEWFNSDSNFPLRHELYTIEYP